MKAAIACSLVLMLAACATRVPAPDDAVAAAALAIAKAEEGGSAAYAPLPLQTAQQRLYSAREYRALETAEGHTQARRLAEQARVDAELALAATESARARVAAGELNRSVEMLAQQQRR